MTIITVRRISQVFFLGLFFWFCLVMTIGEAFWQLRGWPVNWLIQLDPLVGLAFAITTGGLHPGLWWGLLTLSLTILLGRFFCGWVCPLGTLNQFIGFCAHGRKTLARRVALNRYHPAQGIKYLLLIGFLGSITSLQTGLLDPLPLLHRSMGLIITPLLEYTGIPISSGPRHYPNTALIGLILGLALGMNLVVPRFYCRFVCPLGALFGIFSRLALWRMGKAVKVCPDCLQCEACCEGACNPSAEFRTSECVLCMNCRPACGPALMTFQSTPSAGGEILLPDPGRRRFGLALATGLSAVPLLRLEGSLGKNWDPDKIRPPGSLAEAAFLARCLKCGQCLRICPTNIIQPSGLASGLEALWTPVLNFRMGTSGCQLNCIACGHVCPTGAISPLELDRKLGRGAYQEQGPIRMGLAFVDQGRCLPWAMNRPCIVCQENCPVSPKAIQTQVHFQPVPDIPALQIASANAATLVFENEGLQGQRLDGGDYYCRSLTNPAPARLIINNTGNSLTLAATSAPAAGERIEILLRLQRPWVEPSRCIGCGICEHECPVQGRRAIRVTAENESREKDHALIRI